MTNVMHLESIKLRQKCVDYIAIVNKETSENPKAKIRNQETSENPKAKIRHQQNDTRLTTAKQQR